MLITSHRSRRNKYETPKVMFTLHQLNVSFHHYKLIPLLGPSEAFDRIPLFRGHVLRLKQQAWRTGNLPESHATVGKSTAGAIASKGKGMSNI